MNQTQLAGLLCARLCHDLGSPVGAVVNGIDLIRELGPGAAADELDMLARSAGRAAALLRFHRLAFGAVREPEARVGRAELCQRAREVLAGPRVTLDCSAPDGPPLGANRARLAALMLLAGRAMLGLGGTLRLVLAADADLPVAVIAEGARAAASDDQRRWLAGGQGPAPRKGLAPLGPAPDAPEIEFALLPAVAAEAGARLELVEGEGQLALRALPA